MNYTPWNLFMFTLFLFHRATMTGTGAEDVEEQYVQENGNYPFSFSEWDAVRGWYKEFEQKQLKKFCTIAHKAAGYGECIVDTVVVDLNRLIFTNEKYKARDVTTLTYGINGTLWYLIESARENCAFYLDLVNIHKMQFKLRQKVCGLEALEVYIPPKIPDPMDYD